MDEFHTISAETEGLYKVKGSKFITYLRPIDQEEHGHSFLQEIRSLHPKAAHHCYAWRIYQNDLIERQNDDGEPSGTAGKPILGQLIKYDLVNVAAIVVRYFGGTLLGKTGLIQAYKTSTAETIALASITKVIVQTYFIIELEFHLIHLVEEWAPKFEMVISDRQMGTDNAQYSMHCDQAKYEDQIHLLKSKLLDQYIEETPEDIFEFPDFKITVIS